MDSKKNITASLLKVIAKKSICLASESRCMYIFHQPEQPAGIKKFLNS